MAPEYCEFKKSMPDPSEPVRESEILQRALAGFRTDLPESWAWKVEPRPKKESAFDAVVTVVAPNGQKAVLVVEAKRLVPNREVAMTLEQLRSKTADEGLRDAVPLVVARYLSPDTRERLERAGAAYADATGNRRLVLERPALVVRSIGAGRDPWRGPGRPRGSLKGAPAARVIRWLADITPPYTPLQIAEGSATSTGATYRVLRFLEEEGLVQREPRGPITVVRWRQILERWSRDSGFQRGPVESLLFPRGVEALVAALRAAPDLRYVLTGSLAARRYAPYAPPRFAMFYAADVSGTIERLSLRKVDAGANVLLAEDRDEVAFERSEEFEGTRLAAPAQVATDLLTGPGRSPNEGQELLDWMEANEREWRR